MPGPEVVLEMPGVLSREEMQLSPVSPTCMSCVMVEVMPKVYTGCKAEKRQCHSAKGSGSQGLKP